VSFALTFISIYERLQIEAYVDSLLDSLRSLVLGPNGIFDVYGGNGDRIERRLDDQRSLIVTSRKVTCDVGCSEDESRAPRKSRAFLVEFALMETVKAQREDND